ncbi:MAG TPA: outer membrane lipoprotein carrier protein LolA [Desulfonatronum sp.]|nr:outer membrane lipoprotein carrier protein LolA [Desulfonatronum sp.]
MPWKTYAALSALLIFFCGASASAEETTVVRIQRQYETITSFQADFVQELRVAASRESEERRGVLYYQNPGLIRWETLSPEKELLVVGPEHVWNYFEQEETAYRYSSGDVLGSAMVLRILSGEARLDEDFLTEEDLSANADWKSIRLVPRHPEPNLVEATIWVDPQTFVLHRVLALDFYGNTNQITLQDLRINLDLDPSLFTFTVPDGVMVHDNR